MPPKAAKSKEAPAERPILGRFSSHLKIGIVSFLFFHLISLQMLIEWGLDAVLIVTNQMLFSIILSVFSFDCPK